MVPLTASLYCGLVVPMPTLPPLVILIRSVIAVVSAELARVVKMTAPVSEPAEGFSQTAVSLPRKDFTQQCSPRKTGTTARCRHLPSHCSSGQSESPIEAPHCSLEMGRHHA